jgi:hypothetical protein
MGWDLNGLWRDLKFDVNHVDRFGRIAIAGDIGQAWRAKLSDPYFLRPRCVFSILLNQQRWGLGGQYLRR